MDKLGAGSGGGRVPEATPWTSEINKLGAGGGGGTRGLPLPGPSALVEGLTAAWVRVPLRRLVFALLALFRLDILGSDGVTERDVVKVLVCVFETDQQLQRSCDC